MMLEIKHTPSSLITMLIMITNDLNPSTNHWLNALFNDDDDDDDSYKYTHKEELESGIRRFD